MQKLFKKILTLIFSPFIYLIKLSTGGLKPMEHNPTPKYVDPKLKRFVDDFITMAEKFDVPIDLSRFTISVGETGHPDNVFAVSIGRQVIFRPQTLNNPVDNIRWIMFHELGHGVLGLPHRSDKEAIMNNGGVVTNPIITEWDMENNDDRLVELFN